MRKVHYLLTLVLSLFIMSMAVTGAFLALQPVVESTTQAGPTSVHVGALVSIIQASVPDVLEVTRNANGKITAIADSGDEFLVLGQAMEISPKPAVDGPFLFFKRLHRAFLLRGNGGGILSAVAAFALLSLCVTGAFLLARRMGGWRKFFAPATGTLFQRLHVQVSRAAVALLVLTTLTGLTLSASTFGLLPDDLPEAEYPLDAPFGPASEYRDMPALAGIDVSDLRSLELPFPDDEAPVIYLATASAEIYISAATGFELSRDTGGLFTAIYNFFYMLHSGEGLWWLGVILGIAALAVPFLTLTGLVLWLRRVLQRTSGQGNKDAPIHILVASETGTTWGFAHSLREALSLKGQDSFLTDLKVGPKALFDESKTVFILAASYGAGEAPQNAGNFLAALTKANTPIRATVDVLGFGDRSFEHFCGFAKDIHQACAQKSGASLGYAEIDRQSAQAFEAWGRERGLKLNYKPQRQPTKTFKLMESQTFGEAVEAPLSRMVFDTAGQSFQPGDLIGFYPPKEDVARFYSVGSASSTGRLELLVRHLADGKCSSFLQSLKPGDSVDGFIKANPSFQAPRGKAPLVLIAAGTGLAPFAGFAAENRAKRDLHLFWGGRSQASDDLLAGWAEQALDEGRLSSAHRAFSRDGQGYVQDRLPEQIDTIREALDRNGSLMICGSLGLAEGVCRVLTDLGFDLDALKSQGRLRQDVY